MRNATRISGEMGATILECEAAGPTRLLPNEAHPVSCRVVALEDATSEIRIVRLEGVSGRPFRFTAGQYARVTFAEQQRPREYSMASCPDDAIIEFHVRLASTSGTSAYVARKLQVGDCVKVEGPFGHAWLRDDHCGPMLAIAGGSGLAPMKSIVETAIRHRCSRDIRLYVGARTEAEFYLEDHFRELSAAHPQMRFIPVLDEPYGSRPRRTGTVIDAVAADFNQFNGLKAYVAGPPSMVAAAVNLLLGRGLAPSDLHADLYNPGAR